MPPQEQAVTLRASLEYLLENTFLGSQKSVILCVPTVTIPYMDKSTLPSAVRSMVALEETHLEKRRRNHVLVYLFPETAGSQEATVGFGYHTNQYDAAHFRLFLVKENSVWTVAHYELIAAV